MPQIVSLLMVAAMLFPGLTSSVLQDSDPVPPSQAAPAADAPQWTVWGADQYALADDGAAIWIGGVGGVVRWDKQQATYRRYSMVDGLPHARVLAVAVDAAGSRWFGGDGGLSRLDPAGNWTHLQTTNSGLYSNHVDGAAVVGGETLYVSHGLPDGSISRRDPDGSWHWFPNRTTAIQADYAAIVQGRGSNPLWTVAGSEVWAGMRVFNGAYWIERKPPTPVEEPLALAVDSRDHVWVLFKRDYGWIVYEWDGAGWVEHSLNVRFTGRYTALAIDQEDRVWLGKQDRTGSYTNEYASVEELGDSNTHRFDVPGPVAALLPTPVGLWAAGPGWLMRPDFSLHLLTDGPRFQGLTDAMVDRYGVLWLSSGVLAPYSMGQIQALDDRGTLALEDDEWQVRVADPPAWSECELVAAFERVGSDVWYTGVCLPRLFWYQRAVRYHQGLRIEYPTPARAINDSVDLADIGDIYAQDERHVWFVSRNTSGAGVYSLDDGGTPADLTDDAWQSIPIEGATGKLSVAVDARGILWYGEANGLHRYDGAAWQQVYGERAVCDLAPAADGTLYVQVEVNLGAGCSVHSDRVVAVRPNGEIGGLGHPHFVKGVVENEESRVRTASRRNSLWTVVPGGAIWYISRLDSGQELQRRTAAGLDAYALPVSVDAVRRLEVDGRDHVRIVTDSQLWRMAGPPTNRTYLPLIAR